MAMKTTGRIKRASERKGNLPFLVVPTKEHSRKPFLAYGVKSIKKVEWHGRGPRGQRKGPKEYFTEVTFRTARGDDDIWLHCIEDVLAMETKELLEIIEKRESEIREMRG